MEIKRDSYLEQLKIRKDNGMIKIITEYLFDHIIKIALDGIENGEMRDLKKFFLCILLIFPQPRYGTVYHDVIHLRQTKKSSFA